MPKAVRYEEYGGVEVLNVVDVPMPEPGPGQVLVQVKAAGDLEVPIEATFPLDQVRDAYRLLARGHLLGKIVLLP